MKEIKEKDIRKADNIERCRMILEIIRGEAVYTKEGE